MKQNEKKNFQIMCLVSHKPSLDLKTKLFLLHFDMSLFVEILSFAIKMLEIEFTLFSH